jgi:transposase
MNPALAIPFPSLDEAAALTPQQIVELIGALRQEVTALKQQLDWFKRQLFGQKSERRIETGPNGQMTFGELLTQPTLPAPPGQPVAAHTRKPATRTRDDEAVPFFDETRVPVEVIELHAPETDGLGPEDYEVISHKESYRLAQRPGSYVVIKYRRPVVKIKASEALVCAAAPAGVPPVSDYLSP